MDRKYVQMIQHHHILSYAALECLYRTVVEVGSFALMVDESYCLVDTEADTLQRHCLGSWTIQKHIIINGQHKSNAK